VSRITPRLRTEDEGVRMVSLKVIDDETSFCLCSLVPTRRYSVLDGLTTKRFEVSHECMMSRVVDSRDRAGTLSCEEKEM
jgi:hypothetical protein